MNIDLKDLEKQFHADGYRLGMRAVEHGYSQENLFEAVRELFRLVDDLVNSFSEFAGRQNRKPDCKKGCSWCCYQPVFALGYELDYLRHFVARHFDSAAQDQVAVRASRKREKLADLSGDALFHSKFPCPLLVDGICSAYEARPVACRIYLSAHLETCLQFYRNPEDKTSYPALLELPMRLGRMLNDGFRAALKTNGVDVAEFRIEERLG